MMVWGEALDMRTTMPAGLRWGAIADRLSPAARDLSPTVTVCHNLPWCVSFSSDLWRSAFRRNNEVLRGCHSISLTELQLYRSEFSKRTETRSVASDLFLENEVEGRPRTVTVCHIKLMASRTKNTSQQAGNDGIEDETPSAGLSGEPNSVSDQPQTDVQRRQLGDDSQQSDDIRRQQATTFGLPNQASRGCPAGRPIAGVQIHSVGSQQYQATYDQHRSGGARRSPCTHIDRIANAGPERLCNHDKKRQNAKPAIPPQFGRGQQQGDRSFQKGNRATRRWRGLTDDSKSVAPRLRKAMALESPSQVMVSSVSTGMMESHRRLTVIDTKDL